MQSIIYNSLEFKYYKSAKYNGISILTNKSWNTGEAIFWCSTNNNHCGFTYNEAIEYNLINNENSNNFFKGPTNNNYTYDDSISRNITKQLFEKEFNIILHDHPGLYIPEVSEDFSIYLKFKDGKYCEDLVGYSKDLNKKIFVEVERSEKEHIFTNDNDKPITILVSKYWKYFDDGNSSNIHYMCFINENINKACIIAGTDIINCKKIYKALPMKNGLIKEIYEIPKSIGKIFNI